MLIYALAWEILHGRPPVRVELRFVEADLIGRASFSGEDVERARAAIREATAGIRQNAFDAKPNEFVCRWCAYQAICPFAFRTP